MKHINTFVIQMLLVFAGMLSAQNLVQNSGFAEIVAFPGAEGFGKFAKGGRGGKVMIVDNLNNDGEGSLRAACEASGARTVVFATGGTITLASTITIKSPLITIAGQTAPGGGIAVRTNGGNFQPLMLGADDIIIRHIRVRPGPASGGGENGDAVTIISGHDIIIDHCSISWGVDENLNGWYDPYNISIQNCIISEGLNAGHEKGNHSAGALFGDATNRSTMYRNLFAHNWMRNAFLKNDRDGQTSIFQFANNVIYNWGYHGTQIGGSNGQTQVNVVGNYYKPGMDYDRSLYNELMVWDNSKVYVKGNIGPRRPDDSMDEWRIAGNWDTQASTVRRSLTPFSSPEFPVMSAQEAYDKVLQTAGATKPDRDDVDKRIIMDVKNGTGRIIDSPADVGGWPDLAAGAPPSDQDKDGMPDAWEKSRGLDSSKADHNGHDLHAQYTNLEIYLQVMAGDIDDKPTSSRPRLATNPKRAVEYVLEQNYPNPFNPQTSISYSIPKKEMVTLTVYDLLGKKVATLVNNEVQIAGRHTVTFDGSDVSSGTYLYKLHAGEQVLMNKMMVIK